MYVLICFTVLLFSSLFPRSFVKDDVRPFLRYLLKTKAFEMFLLGGLADDVNNSSSRNLRYKTRLGFNPSTSNGLA